MKHTVVTKGQPASRFLPVSREEMEERGWDELDFLMVSGDAYVDHPSFGIAIIARLLEEAGYRVGIMAQPDWKDTESFRRLGRPRLACLISGGNLDSLVNHYTAAKKRRSQDAYSPGGQTGLRPDRATIVYSNKVREALPGVPVILGGIEASLRRFAHYDYWSNKLRRSILLDSQADMLIFGMGERAILDVAKALAAGKAISKITNVRGTMIPWQGETPQGFTELPAFEDISISKLRYTESCMCQYQEQDPYRGKGMLERYVQDRKGVLQNPPTYPLTQEEMDSVYALPYTRTYHPMYEAAGGIPALQEVEFSLVSARGCYGSCSFCAIAFHQGRIVQSRSAESIVHEAEKLTYNPHFKGYIHDVGGPTANFRRAACPAQWKRGACAHRQCLFPEPCGELDADHSEYLDLLRQLRKLPRVKKVFIRSGIRYDVVLADKQSDFLTELCAYHVSGQLKVAPEHVSDAVLKRMGKPGRKVYETFVNRYIQTNRRLSKKQYLVPYLMSSHPGSTLREAVELAEYVRDMGVNPEQVQDFIPTPGTLSTCMYYTGLDPRTSEKVYVPRTQKEKAMQRALIQYRNPANDDLVREALHLAHREDLIGFGSKCLIKPKRTPSETGKQTGKGQLGHPLTLGSQMGKTSATRAKPGGSAKAKPREAAKNAQTKKGSRLKKARAT
ncbi:MAG: YgiQ family radical SAM protein [Desulfitobacteriaceae bacterium]|nr:YgiQ family radical SAM protein [Desulfitobacteriaceae bacterium]MDI6879446.1 YgiQ family radical SAM protein [Desulfitobacteriaceae bacterium]MDI6915029.1 YgiQ family radical SAM protein [Desulfitobacteriaceae bacterium]